MTVTDMGEIELPPGFLPLRVPIEVHFTQRVAVDVALRTADGLPLGEPVRLSVHSNAYGKVLFFITLTGGRDARRCSSAAGCGTGSAANPTAPTSTGPTSTRTRRRRAADADARPESNASAHGARPRPWAAPELRPVTPRLRAHAIRQLPPPRRRRIPPRLPRGPHRRAPESRTVRRRGGVPLVGHGVRNPDQPASPDSSASC